MLCRRDGLARHEVVSAPVGLSAGARSPSGRLLPHVWLTRRDGTTCSTHDFTGTSARFVLITNPSGAQTWPPPSEELAVVTIRDGGEYTDATGEWQRLREMSDEGAIPVRPDTH